MLRYSFHLNLIALSGPVFILSAVINPKKLITGWFGIFLLVILIGSITAHLYVVLTYANTSTALAFYPISFLRTIGQYHVWLI